jgi:hypothetical protein
MVAVLRAIGVHSERTTPELANTHGRVLILAALPEVFDSHTLSSIHYLLYHRPILYILASPLLSVVDADVLNDYVGFIQQIQQVGEPSGFCS